MKTRTEHHYDESRNVQPTAVMADGRTAFWNGRAVWSNPNVGDSAKAWLKGWVGALVELQGLLQDDGVLVVPMTPGGMASSPVLARYRPANIKAGRTEGRRLRNGAAARQRRKEKRIGAASIKAGSFHRELPA